jgi:hypothetical protein
MVHNFEMADLDEPATQIRCVHGPCHHVAFVLDRCTIMRPKTLIQLILCATKHGVKSSTMQN